MAKSYNLIAKFGALVFHELFHYLAARALGLPAALHWNYVYVKFGKFDWREFVVTLAPAVATLVLNGWAAWRFMSHGLWFILPIIALNTLGWLLMCWQDFYDVIYMLRYRTFCTQVAPPIPYIHQRWWDERSAKTKSVR